ncbi:uridine kinase [Porifericola rhodea]|uniref:uridine kinase family protein n=1 Tax=Porifericola rhodea TaxID=930972 RepID=UPI002666B508|nr:uridine kinase [Porifericola rhodea]WKN32865.1 uridine kinase [Porifericola rhodea]
MNRPYIVGISGGSGSGKTQVLTWLQRILDPEDICLFSQDNYYRDRLTTSADEVRAFNFDDPNVIDVAQFADDLSQLRQGYTVNRREYTFNKSAANAPMLEFRPAPIIVVEGIFIFHYKEIKSLLDLKVFVDVQEHLKFTRRIARDTRERGYLLDDVLYKYTEHVAPAYDKFIAPYRHSADIVIPNNQHCPAHKCPPAVEVLSEFLKSKIL